MGLHAALLVVAWHAGKGARASVADERANLLLEVSFEPSVNSPEPGPIPEPQERTTASALARPSSPRRARLAEPSPSSSRGTSTDPAPGPDAPVDLTGDTLVLASTGRSAGGSGDASGSGRRVGRGIGGSPNGAAAVGSGTGDRSGGVSLEDHRWACPWPREADVEQIDEQTVVIKVVVDPDGTVESVTVLADPGHGFGQAAIACALHTRFVPARDREGRPIRAESPSVLVRFTR